MAIIANLNCLASSGFFSIAAFNALCNIASAASANSAATSRSGHLLQISREARPRSTFLYSRTRFALLVFEAFVKI